MAAVTGSARTLIARAADGAAGILVYDPRFPAARQRATGWSARRRFEVGLDAGRLWTTHLAGPAEAGVELTGLTCGADATLLRDLARIHRLRLYRWQPQPAGSGGSAGGAVLVEWILGSIGRPRTYYLP